MQTQQVTAAQRALVVLTPAQDRHLRYLTRCLNSWSVNSPKWLLVNDAINKFYVAIITNTLPNM